MKRQIRWTVSLILMCFLMAGTAYGQGEEDYWQMAQQILRRMEESMDGVSQVETGITFTSSKAASEFADYFYMEGYWGEERLRIGIVSYSDRPSYYELVVLITNPRLAAYQHRVVEEEIRKLSDTIKEATQDDLERAESAYDWIYQKLDYDHSLKNISLYQALGTGKGICFGYAGLFKAVCQNLGLECEIVYGDNHSWNRVRLNGEWRYVDITWDKGLGEHKWRLVTEETWKLTHPTSKESGT